MKKQESARKAEQGGMCGAAYRRWRALKSQEFRDLPGEEKEAIRHDAWVAFKGKLPEEKDDDIPQQPMRAGGIPRPWPLLY
eukprot:6689386-Lingulodinium_polyedra.AAC.1